MLSDQSPWDKSITQTSGTQKLYRRYIYNIASTPQNYFSTRQIKQPMQSNAK